MGGRPAHEDAGIDEERAVAVEDACASPRRQHEPAQHRPDPLGIDREFERGVGVVARRIRNGIALPGPVGGMSGRRLEQLLGIEPDRIGVDARRGRDGGGDDLALRLQALHAGVDQPLAELVDVEEGEGERHEPADVEEHDAPCQRRGEVRRHGAASGSRAADQPAADATQLLPAGRREAGMVQAGPLDVDAQRTLIAGWRVREPVDAPATP